MPARRLPATALHLRRGRRTDLAAVRALLGRAAVPGAQRFDRRVVADLGDDVYVAHGADGVLLGCVALAYVRSLSAGAWVAVLDALAVAAAAPPALRGELLDFALVRARRRGCRRVRAWPAPDDDALRGLLIARGWREDAGLGTALESVEAPGAETAAG